MPEMKLDRLVIVDIETTGLDFENDYILEVGFVIADAELNELSSCHWLVNEVGALMQLHKNQFVLDMHTKSGLIRDLRAVPEEDRRGYGKTTAEIFEWLIYTQEIGIGEYPMVGSNVGGFDRQFLKRRMPTIEGLFHYRSPDVSSLKAFGQFFSKDLVVAYNAEDRFKKENAVHRAVPDCRTSLAELRFWRDNLFGVAMLDD